MINVGIKKRPNRSIRVKKNKTLKSVVERTPYSTQEECKNSYMELLHLADVADRQRRQVYPCAQ
ncbi:hypothetical protein A2524_01165 [Candidatus Wolfebacteria bacterium RIFOXYD12_FULL_48_21]|uniref:Uncharacterized protein n=1 Tax=Candidatus Wolfebacteria bacterium RIFOXYD1_FULL_48_65 TaxID=1802561 RepID=A0A1F8E0H0_9BACT|nr:MAG: hypothetical protein A2610_03110 [Candidatus Wolfebacteria bacterium RIFOXYD1_FULL_48_65]OGM94419.1 MAG: hypothetical protein A2524_01165 [Candidatus Wolfebacteria bacterium RIFOXYD12_FULL_48_21]OGM97601.1 MAG: hypothetical protein A2532_00020 [Candidatus Wolfebacteria bacterium RIFOXYD2_FULL_48_11]